jgi:leader peptidase (prepilin peptidase)/N-methyltransferase
MVIEKISYGRFFQWYNKPMFEILFFILGASVGSFLNVVVIRYGTGIGYGGRSMCASSGKCLRWFELIPIVSFFLQKGRSRYTGAKLSWQYPIVEFLTGVLFVLSFRLAFSFVDISIASFALMLAFYILSSCFLMLVATYDAKHMIVPNEFVYPLVGLSFISLFVELGSTISFALPSLESLLAGPLVALPFVILWVVSRGKWMGFADAKIALFIGWFLGISGGFAAVLISFWVGAIIGVVVLLVLPKDKRNNLKIPFAPFLLTGLILTLLYNIDITNLLLWFV